jgi:hypothetical protein
MTLWRFGDARILLETEIMIGGVIMVSVRSVQIAFAWRRQFCRKAYEQRWRVALAISSHAAYAFSDAEIGWNTVPVVLNMQ